MEKISEIGAYEFELPNGITVCLRPIDDSDDILIRGIAPGGFSVLPVTQRSSGKLAADIAWDSGFGPWSGNELGNKLLTDSIELDARVTPFSRSIDGMASPARIEELLQVIQQLYTAPHFDQSAMAAVKKRLSESVQLRHQDPEMLFEDVIRSVNTGDLAVLHPVTAEDLRNIDFEVAKKFYLENFLSTDGLKFIIVGEFDVQTTVPLVAKYLGAIPKKSAAIGEELAPKISIPPGVNKQELVSKKLQECLTRLTFQLDLNITESSWQQLEIAAQVIETRLRTRFQEVLGSTQGIDVAYEFPYYPHNSPAWLAIQFRCPNCKTDGLVALILAEFQRLRTDGPTQQELEKVRRQQEVNDEFWLQHKRYWLEQLSNYYLWGLDIRGMIKDYKNSPHYKPELIKEFLTKHLVISGHTMVLLKPK